MNTYNDFILVPELTIEKIINQVIIFLRKDYNTQVEEFADEKLSYLYTLTANVGYQRLNLFEQAKKIFLTEKDETKRIRIYLQFPQKIETGVSVCITHSGEQHSQNVLSVDESDDNYESVYESTIPEVDKVPNYWRKSFSRRYAATYSVIITGENTNETLITYLIIKAVLISLEGTGHLNGFGFTNVKLSSNDMQIKSELTKIMYAKSININFDYEFKVPDITRQKIVNAAIFSGIAKNEN